MIKSQKGKFLRNAKVKSKKFILVLLYCCIVVLLYCPLPVFANDEGKPLGELKGLPGAYEPGGSIETAGTTLSKIFTNTFGVMTIIAGLMFILYFILGGISWIAAGGQPDKVENAKKQMTNAVIGLIIVVAAYGIAFIVGNVLGIPILQPGLFLEKISPGGN